MQQGGADEFDYLEWDTSELPEDERDEILEAAVSDVGADVGVVANEADLEEIQADDFGSSLAGSAPGPQIGEIGDPELVLVVLESTLIAIEASKIGRKAAQKTSGMGTLVRERFRESLTSNGQQVETKSADSISHAVDQSSK